jgi:hypothetical protein
MDHWQNYLLVLQHDLLFLAQIFLVVGIGMVLPAWFVAAAAAGRDSRIGWPLFWRVLFVAWRIGVGGLVLTFLLGWALMTQLHRNLKIDSSLTPPAFWPILGVLSFGIAIWLAYRHAAAYLKLALLQRNTTTAANVPVAGKLPSTHFTLGTFFLYQLLGLLIVGLWIECRRDWVMEQYKEQERVASNVRWEQSVVDRFGSYGWRIDHSPAVSPTRNLKLFRPGPLQKFDDSVLDRLKPADELVALDIQSDNLTDRGLKMIARNELLEALAIESGQVTDAGIAELPKLAHLQHLRLRCPKLTDDCLEHFANRQGWTLVVIESPLITVDGLKSFNSRHPGKNIRVINLSFP